MKNITIIAVIIALIAISTSTSALPSQSKNLPLPSLWSKSPLIRNALNSKSKPLTLTLTRSTPFASYEQIMTTFQEAVLYSIYRLLQAEGELKTALGPWNEGTDVIDHVQPLIDDFYHVVEDLIYFNPSPEGRIRDVAASIDKFLDDAEALYKEFITKVISLVTIEAPDAVEIVEAVDRLFLADIKTIMKPLIELIAPYLP